MDTQEGDDAQQRDAILLRMLKTPPQPRPKRERGQKVSQEKERESSVTDIRHRSDGSRAIAATDELLRLLSGLSPHQVHRIDDILDLLRSKAENLFVVRGYDPTASRAEDRVIFLEPSLLFNEFMATIRARTKEM